MNRRLAILVGCLLLLGVVAERSYRLGVNVERGRTAQALLAEQAAADTQEAARRVGTEKWLAERDSRLDLERQLNEDARQDPDAARPAFGPASVRQLNRVR